MLADIIALPLLLHHQQTTAPHSNGVCQEVQVNENRYDDSYHALTTTSIYSNRRREKLIKLTMFGMGLRAPKRERVL